VYWLVHSETHIGLIICTYFLTETHIRCSCFQRL